MKNKVSIWNLANHTKRNATLGKCIVSQQQLV